MSPPRGAADRPSVSRVVRCRVECRSGCYIGRSQVPSFRCLHLAPPVTLATDGSAHCILGLLSEIIWRRTMRSPLETRRLSCHRVTHQRGAGAGAGSGSGESPITSSKRAGAVVKTACLESRRSRVRTS